MSWNDYSQYNRGRVEQPEGEHDYGAIFEHAQNPDNWFKRFRGEWHDDQDRRCRWCGRNDP